MKTIPFKENWPETEARMKAWWDRKTIKRVPLSISVRRSKNVVYPKPINPKMLYCDKKFLSELLLVDFKNQYYVAETIPKYNFMLGYAFPGVFMGQKPYMDFETVWFTQTGEALENMGLDFDPEDKLWKNLMDLNKSLLDVSMQSVPIFIQPMDVISMVLGAEKTCFELIERPELVKSCRDKLTVTFKKMFNESYTLLKTKYEGSAGWLPLWSPGKSFPLQCDFSCMVSVDMFEEFVVPELEDLTKFLDNSIYHLDGVTALHHLPRLLKLEKLGAIQWTAGAGKPEGMHWGDLYKQVLEADKGMFAMMPAKDVEKALKTLPHEGLWIDTSVDTIEEANELIKMAEKYK